MKLFALLPEGDRTLEGLMGFLGEIAGRGDETSDGGTVAKDGGPTKALMASSSSSAAKPAPQPVVRMSGEFIPSPLLVDTVDNFQVALPELLVKLHPRWTGEGKSGVAAR